MRMMHTKLPEFIEKMINAGKKGGREKPVAINGLENLKSAKMQSLRTGRIEQAVQELATREGIEKIELTVMPRVPETMHTVLIKALDKDGKAQKAVIDVINILHPTEEAFLGDCPEIEDRRPPIGRH
ncbi:MAG: hypothetical protein FWG66_07315 [Spirochaetes bacterium]|nr:hypothetical protein [Spirochaetota bacterium]